VEDHTENKGWGDFTFEERNSALLKGWDLRKKNNSLKGKNLVFLGGRGNHLDEIFRRRPRLGPNLCWREVEGL